MWYSIIGVIVFLGQYLFYNWNPAAYYSEIVRYKEYSINNPEKFFHFCIMARSLLWPFFVIHLLGKTKK
jgi:hypothetical protein